MGKLMCRHRPTGKIIIINIGPIPYFLHEPNRQQSMVCFVSVSCCVDLDMNNYFNY